MSEEVAGWIMFALVAIGSIAYALGTVLLPMGWWML